MKEWMPFKEKFGLSREIYFDFSGLHDTMVIDCGFHSG